MVARDLKLHELRLYITMLSTTNANTNECRFAHTWLMEQSGIRDKGDFSRAMKGLRGHNLIVDTGRKDSKYNTKIYEVMFVEVIDE
jgi:hypothetical protein